MWFVKVRRAQNDQDFETWKQGGVATTLNVMDNTGESRATVLIIDGTRVNDVRVYEDGIVPTVISRYGTGGGNVPMIFEQEKEVIGPLTASGMSRARGTETVESHHYVQNESVVRRLTPTECERLQGFPEIKNTATFDLCLDHLSSLVDAEIQNLKWQKFVGSVGNGKSSESVWSALSGSSPKNQQISEPAQILVRINCEARQVEILSQGNLIWSANNVGNQNWLALPIKTDDFVQASVGLMQIVEQITIGGAVELRRNEEKTLTEVTLGNFAEKQFGSAIKQLASDANSSLIEAPNATMSTTSSLTDLRNLEQNLRTLFSFVSPAIDGFIPTPTEEKSLFTFQLETIEGWTGNQADTHRYKQMGNAVAVPVVSWIVNRLMGASNDLD